MPWMQHFQSANWNQVSWIALGAYALGCFTTGYYLVKLRTGQDIRDVGSGTVGARNVGRLLGWPGFWLTVAGDFAKGAFAVWAVKYFRKDDSLLILSMIAVVAGHVWPVQLFFRGGKGVATSLGALLLYDYHLAGAFALVFAIAFAFLRRTVLPGLFAFACLPLVCMWEEHNNPRTIGISMLAALVLLAHRKNLVEEFSLLIERSHARQEQRHRAKR